MNTFHYKGVLFLSELMLYHGSRNAWLSWGHLTAGVGKSQQFQGFMSYFEYKVAEKQSTLHFIFTLKDIILECFYL